MRKVYVIGTACTPFGKHEDKSFQDLARWAYADLLPDCGLDARRRAADRTGLVRQLRHGPVGAGRHPRPGGLHAAGRRRAVPRARADDQCRRRLRHRLLRLPRCVEGRAVRPGRGQPGDGRGKAGQPRRSRAHRGDLRHRHRPARSAEVARLLRCGRRAGRQALRDRARAAPCSWTPMRCRLPGTCGPTAPRSGRSPSVRRRTTTTAA